MFARFDHLFMSTFYKNQLKYFNIFGQICSKYLINTPLSFLIQVCRFMGLKIKIIDKDVKKSNRL